MINNKILALSVLIITSVSYINPSLSYAYSPTTSPILKASIIKSDINPYLQTNEQSAYSTEIFQELEKLKNDADQDNNFLEITNQQDSVYYTYKSFILSHNPKIKGFIADKIITNVKFYSKENALDPKLVFALMAKESSFRSNVVSHSGAIGLGQLKRGTAREVGVTNPFNIVENIKGTTRYLAKLMKYCNGDEDRTLASYNMGMGAVDRTLKAGNKLPSDVERYVYKIKNFKKDI